MRLLVSTSPHKVKGGVLLESLVGLLIMGIIGAGMVHITARVSVNQQQMQLQDIAVREMRGLLLQHSSGSLDLCGGSTPALNLPNIADPIELVVVGCDPTDAQITINGMPVTVPGARRPLVLSLETDDIGLIRVGGHGDV